MDCGRSLQSVETENEVKANRKLHEGEARKLTEQTGINKQRTDQWSNLGEL